MTTPTATFDGLRHCICPSLKRVPAGARIALSRVSARRPTLLSGYGAASRASSTHSSRKSSQYTYKRPSFLGGAEASRLLSAHSLTVLESVATSEIYERLRQAATATNVYTVDRLLHYLLIRRREKPNPALYSACIRSNSHAQYGSAAAAAALLKEMGDEGLEPTVEICHDILRVLAVHPDYLLRNAILDYMRQRWFSLRADGHQDVVVGLLREQQYELALDHLDTMAREGIRIEKWLYDMAVYMLCDIEEVDEALRIIKQRTESGELHISKGIWHYLLDAASSCLHHEAAEYVWNRQVKPGYINPTSGICFNILTIAARHGDAVLATDVFRLLSERKEIFTQQHYEALIDTYLFAGDIGTALSILCIMHETSTPPDEYSTRKLYRWASVHTERSQEAFKILMSLKESGQTVPVVAGHALIEATVHRDDLDQAIEQYKALHIVCDGSPTTTTFNILLRGCQKRKELAMFLAAEMVARKVEPDSLTYDRLLLVCLVEQDYEDAFRYYEEMRNRGWTPRPATFVAMARRCARAKDQRAWEVLDMMKECGVDADGVRSLRTWLDNNWGKVSMDDPEITR